MLTTNIRAVIVIALAASLMGLTCGCMTHVYKVQPDPQADIADCYRLIDRTIKQNSSQWEGPTAVRIGADEKGFTVIELTGMNPGVGGMLYGQPAFYRWDDVTDVSIRAQIFPLFLIFIDPTLDSGVQITFRDGKKMRINLQGGQFPEGCLGCFPLWPFSPKWSRADKLGKAIQAIVSSKSK